MAAAVPRFEEWIVPEAVRNLTKSLGDPPAVAKLRAESYERFIELPIEPNPLYRGYGYFTGVDLTGVNPQASGPSVDLPPGLPGAIRIVHDASGTKVTLPPKAAEAPADRLSALASVLINRGYRLEIPDGYAEPVRVQDLVILSQPREGLSVRRSIRAGTDAQLLLTEEVFSTAVGDPGQRLYASGSDVELGDRTKTVFLTVHAPDLKTVSIYRRTATTGADARLAWQWNGLGGYRSKVRNQTRLVGSGSHVDDLQTFYGAKDQSYDSSVDFTHVGTDTHGQSITRGVFTDHARGMSRGLVRIESEARKTVAYVSEHAMLLARGARSDTIPILEILCRDVKATHSTSVAPVDPERVFYLETRGIGPDEAIRMIGEGFLSYVLERSPVAGLREFLYPSLAARWEGRELPWKPGSFHVLPFLSVAGTESAPEWRFDTKLR